MIPVHVLLSGKLRLEGYGRGYPTRGDGTFRILMQEGRSVGDVVRKVGVPPKQVAMTMLNGQQCSAEARVRYGDRLILISSDVAQLWRALGRQNLGMGIGYDRVQATP